MGDVLVAAGGGILYFIPIVNNRVLYLKNLMYLNISVLFILFALDAIINRKNVKWW